MMEEKSSSISDSSCHDGRKKIVFINSNEPIPVITRKINTLHQTGCYKVYLIFWHRCKSDMNFPFSLQIPNNNIIQISLVDPSGSIFNRYFFSLLFWVKTLIYLIKIRPQLIHCVNMDILLQSFILKFYQPKLEFVLDLIDTRNIFLKKSIKTIMSYLIDKTKLIFITSPRYVTHYLTHFGVCPDDPRIVFVPNAPPKTLFKDFKKNTRKGLTIGYIGAFKGKVTIDHLVKIVRQLNKRKYPVRILFAGMGIDLPLVVQYSEQYDFIDYLGAYDYEKDIKFLYEQVDLIFSMYFMDHDKMIHMSCRYHDSVACGIPIIVQAGSYLSELVERFQTGYVVELGRWQHLETLLRNLAIDPSDLMLKSKNCRRILDENIYETYESKVIDSFRKVLNFKSTDRQPISNSTSNENN